MSYTRTKICLFCDDYIPNNMITCRKHVHLWREYKDTTWAQEFKVMQTRQNTISETELKLLQTDYELSPIVKRSMSPSLKEKILELYKEGKSRKYIQIKLNISYDTVKKTIWRYEKQVTTSA